MRADRPLALLLRLQSGGKVTERALAVELDVSVRTVCRELVAVARAAVRTFLQAFGG
ncbi:hypothetical protein [Dactylosporangium sp. NPDC000521]|uniref:hypothetical protein n=1 Tax=Dactylosporangium sp. NPDC000521 TaxID=3363975 RepID=UPI0036ABD0C0